MLLPTFVVKADEHKFCYQYANFRIGEKQKRFKSSTTAFFFGTNRIAHGNRIRRRARTALSAHNLRSCICSCALALGPKLLINLSSCRSKKRRYSLARLLNVRDRTTDTRPLTREHMVPRSRVLRLGCM